MADFQSTNKTDQNYEKHPTVETDPPGIHTMVVQQSDSKLAALNIVKGNYTQN